MRGYVQNEVDTGGADAGESATPRPLPSIGDRAVASPHRRATSVTLYPLANSDQTLLTVNVHAINFSFGVTAYATQLNAVAGLIAAHRGPVVFGGDLNTWSQRRQRTLEALASDLNLTAVPFSPDYRTTRFNRALDHLYVRGLTWRTTQTLPVTTSDHNPAYRNVAARRCMIRVLLLSWLCLGSECCTRGRGRRLTQRFAG